MGKVWRSGRRRVAGSTTCHRGSTVLQQGSSLFEVMLALFLTSVGLLGLWQVQRTLLHTQHIQMQQQDAWYLARNALVWGALPGSTALERVPLGWHLVLRQQAEGACRLLSVEVLAPWGRPVRLTKLICP